MAMHPEIQKKAQAEIDAVVGNMRLPDFDDRPSLPYIEAICREIVRWRVVVPLGIVRKNICDDVYEGWLIPKGTRR